ncbi:MAG: cellulase family glycosylhydrolase [Pirellulales bacterium]|nr:cellulase family glycosylhydrolase [Pirellulales bacterium]
MIHAQIHRLVAILVLLAAPTLASADPLDWIRVSDDQKGFVLDPSGETFVPWGFNYDHDRSGRLIEDYWTKNWAAVEEDFTEMKRLGATVVRVHLQFGRFMTTPNQPNAASLENLARLLKLTERLGLYLDLTGLGCYHKGDSPAWYDRLDEQARWNAQAVFWEAVAKTCADSPAVFCYNLMNEPVVPGKGDRRDDWLGQPLEGKHYIQYITRDAGNRPRQEVASQWVKHMVAAIRRYDQRHLITVGLVPWSLDRPGLSSGFVPGVIADELDFISVHLYPEHGKVNDAVATLRGFAVGKPVVVEETFPLKCSLDDMARFIDQSRPIAAGWLSFYWGQTQDEYRQEGELRSVIVADWLDQFIKEMKPEQAKGKP